MSLEDDLMRVLGPGESLGFHRLAERIHGGRAMDFRPPRYGQSQYLAIERAAKRLDAEGLARLDYGRRPRNPGCRVLLPEPGRTF